MKDDFVSRYTRQTKSVFGNSTTASNSKVMMSQANGGHRRSQRNQLHMLHDDSRRGEMLHDSQQHPASLSTSKIYRSNILANNL